MSLRLHTLFHFILLLSPTIAVDRDFFFSREEGKLLHARAILRIAVIFALAVSNA